MKIPEVKYKRNRTREDVSVLELKLFLSHLRRPTYLVSRNTALSDWLRGTAS